MFHRQPIIFVAIVLAGVAITTGVVRGEEAPDKADAAGVEHLEAFAFEDKGVPPPLSHSKGWTITQTSPAEGSGALALKANFPGDYTVGFERDTSWWKPRAFRMRIFVENPQPAGDTPPGEMVQVSVSAITYDHIWFQHDVPGFVEPGTWRTIEVSLLPKHRQFRPGGHFASWTDAIRSELREFVVKVYSKTEGTATVYIDDIELLGPRGEAPPPLEMTRQQRMDNPLRLLDFKTTRRRVPRYEKFEISFRTNWTFVNPFDDDEVRVTGVFTPSQGQVVKVPGFYYQGFRRQLTPGGGDHSNKLVEDLIPVGPRLWAIRFAPRLVGPYAFHVEIEVGPEDAPVARVRTAEHRFECVEGDSRGFVRLAPKDHRYFETDDGRFFFPKGHNIISPWDKPYKQAYVKNLPIGKRTYAYDDYFEKMGRYGSNVARVWMSYWWVGLEWSEDQGPYYGLGRYSLRNAWRLDHLLEAGREHDVRLLLEVFTHVNLSTRFPTGDESGWRHNPYNKKNGGMLSQPWEFFTDEEAIDRSKTLLRYIVARWGYSTNVFAWSLFSEVDLVDNYYRRDDGDMPVFDDVNAWHARMFRYIKSIDTCGMHLCTSHHHQPKVAREFFELENMDFITANAYASTFLVDDQVPAFLEYCDALSYLRKPNLVTEFGGHWGGSPRSIMVRDFHNGLWFSVVSPLAGVPMFWWWNMIDDANLYPQYGALSNFVEGEDFRNPEAKQQDDEAEAPDVEGEPSIPLGAVSFGDRTSRRIWVYNELNTTRVSPYEFEVEGARLFVYDLRPGDYRIEFWDTFDPERGRFATLRGVSKEGRMVVTMPTFDKDIAIKVKPAE